MSRIVSHMALLVGAISMIRAGVAYADADEASLGGTLMLGYAEVGDETLRPLWPIPLAGLGARLTYAHLDWLAYEVGVEVEHIAISLDFAHDRDDPNDIYPLLRRRLLWARAEVGATLRLGVQWIPTIYAGVGAQGQRAQTLFETTEQGVSEVIPDVDYSWTLIGIVGMGLDYRIDEQWVVGTSLRIKGSAPWDNDMFRSYTALFHLSCYWYPGNLAE